MENKNITWHGGHVERLEREKLLNQKGMVIWLTGLSGSGKSTIAVEIEKELYKQGKLCYRLDGDNVRYGLNNNLGFSIEDRRENVRRVAEVAKLMCNAGLIVIASFISPNEEMRNIAKQIIGDDFNLMYVHASVDTCIKRDPKGLYKKALSGEIKNFTGVSQVFEEPKYPNLVLNTEQYSLKELTSNAIHYINLIK